MRCLPLVPLAVSFLARSVSSFCSSPHSINSRHGLHSQLSTQRFASDDKDGPETSFGSEVVPEGQRPVNEYLNMKSAPLFDWASQETGTKGVS